MKTKDYQDGQYWKRIIEKKEMEGERLPFLSCPDCGMLYPTSEAPRVCEINGAGATLVPVYAIYSEER